jgi:integrase
MKRVGWKGRVTPSKNQLFNSNHAFLIEFSWQMKKNGLSDSTIETRSYLLKKLVKLGADIENPESVKAVLATADVSTAYKREAVKAYTAFAKFKKIEWNKPKIVSSEKQPFLPSNEEVQQIISGCGKNTATFIKFLADTGVRKGEALQVKWTDLDFIAKTVRINNPEKGGNSRTLKISDQLIAMINALKKRTDGNVFNPNKSTIETTFLRSRRRIAQKTQNPRINQIPFHTLRHLKATNEYVRTKDLMYVKYILGHKHSSSTDRYTHYTPFKEEEYHCKVAQTEQERIQLIESGFTFVEKSEGLSFYRKRK